MNNMKLYIVGMVLAVMVTYGHVRTGIFGCRSQKKESYYRQFLQDGE